MIICCTELGVQRHLQMSHGFTEFQCLHCKTGYNDVTEMRKHMSVKHSSQYLFIATRQSTAQIVYIGDSSDYSHFQFSICSNVEALNSMDPSLKSHDQHKTQCNFWLTHQIKKPYLKPISSISFEKMSDEFFIRYDKYVAWRLKAQSNETQTNTPDKAPAPAGIIYKCISDLAASEIDRVNESVPTNLMCDCKESVIITDENDLKPYLDHLAEHQQCYHTELERKMIAHRLTKHANSSMTYLKVETGTGIAMQKLMRCRFRCKIEVCGEEFETRIGIREHFTLNHRDCAIDACIKQNVTIIHSNIRINWSIPIQSIVQLRP